jgi:flagellar motility protein MotE (MotC chaperone)
MAIIVAAVLGPIVTAGTVAMHWKDILTLPAPAESESKEPGKPVIKPSPKEWSFMSTEIEDVAKDLREERAALEMKRQDLEATSKRIAAEKEELKRVRTELEQLRSEITASVPVLQSTEAANIKNLSKVYATMKPTQAVAILESMDDISVVKLLATMKADAVSQIFAEMAHTAGPDGPLAPRVAKLSEQLRLLKKETVAANP